MTLPRLAQIHDLLNSSQILKIWISECYKRLEATKETYTFELKYLFLLHF